MFLREVKIKGKGKDYSYWKIVKSYWDKKKRKCRHKTIMNLGSITSEEREKIKSILAVKKL